MKIGIDIGNVIIGGGGDDTQFFTDDYLFTPEVQGAWESIAALRHNNELHIISKCGIIVEEKSLKWLDTQGFYYSLKPHRIHFVRKRELKAPMAQALQLDVFIDDREDIIETMQGVVKHPILFKSWADTNMELGLIFAPEG
jgi:hypothetical protein